METKKLGHRTLMLRKRRKLSQAELARRAHISRNYLGEIERDEGRRVSVRVLKDLAAALGMTMTELLRESEPEPPSFPEGMVKHIATGHRAPYELLLVVAQLPKTPGRPETPEQWEALLEMLDRGFDVIDRDEDGTIRLIELKVRKPREREHVAKRSTRGKREKATGSKP